MHLFALASLERSSSFQVDLEGPTRVQWGADDALYVSAAEQTRAYSLKGRRGQLIAGTCFRLSPSGTSALFVEEEGPLVVRPLDAKKGVTFKDVHLAAWLDDRRVAALMSTDDGGEMRELVGKKASPPIALPDPWTPVKSFSAYGTTALLGQWQKTKNYLQVVDFKSKKATRIELPGRASEIEVLVSPLGRFVAINWKKELLSLA